MAKFSLCLIWGYKKVISPILHLIPTTGCIYNPTCSQYAKDAIIKHGFLKGSLMGFCRILRCNPFCAGGIDEVPDTFSFKNLFKKNTNNKVDENLK